MSQRRPVVGGHLLWLHDGRWHNEFPSPEHALTDPNGLLAIGGDLEPQTLERAYRAGIFPWYSQGEPVLWWSPDPRAVLDPRAVRISRSLRRVLRHRRFRITMDRAVEAVLHGCARPRPGSQGTWITPDMHVAYTRLHRSGLAHSVESWDGDDLVGGLYGVAIGRVFFGESMFMRQPDASKAALAVLAQQIDRWGYRLIDCQQSSAHLASMGAVDIPRNEFLTLLEHLVAQPGQVAPWHVDDDL